MREGDRLLNDFLDLLRATGKSESTIKHYRLRLVAFLNWRLKRGQNSATSTTPDDIHEYLAYLQNERGLKPNSVNSALAALGSFFGWLADEGHIDRSPTIEVEKLAIQEQPRWLAAQERYRVIRTAMADDNKRNPAIILTFLLAGLRVSELVNLTPDDVVLGRKQGHIVVHSRKGKSVVPIGKDLRQFLGGYLVRHRSTGRWVFGSQRGEQLTDKGVQHICADIGNRAGVPGLTPYVLRHTFIHDLLAAGVPIQTVAWLAGIVQADRLLLYKELPQSGADSLENLEGSFEFVPHRHT